MLRYSERAKVGYGLLFQPFNDLDIYVEDTTGRNIYETLINRILQGQAKVSRVIPLGNCELVIDRCKNDQGQRGRRRLYIVDGDFDFVCGVPAPPMLHFYRLNVYTLENLLFSEEAAVEVAYECLPEKTHDDIADLLRFSEFQLHITEILIPLFVMYAVARLLDPTLRTSGLHVMALCERRGSHDVLSSLKVQAKCEELRSELEGRFGAAIVAERLGLVQSRIPKDPEDQVKWISGKRYLLPLLCILLSSKGGLRGGNDQRVRLARHTRLDIDPDFAKALLQAATRPYHEDESGKSLRS